MPSTESSTHGGELDCSLVTDEEVKEWTGFTGTAVNRFEDADEYCEITADPDVDDKGLFDMLVVEWLLYPSGESATDVLDGDRSLLKDEAESRRLPDGTQALVIETDQEVGGQPQRSIRLVTDLDDGRTLLVRGADSGAKRSMATIRSMGEQITQRYGP